MGEIFEVGEHGDVEQLQKLWKKYNFENYDVSLGSLTGNKQGIILSELHFDSYHGILLLLNLIILDRA